MMGIFDFLTKKKDVKVLKNGQETKPYLGDLAKTDILHTLLQIQPQKRDENWEKSFLEALPQASFRCGDPQIITGPDGFSYFQLFLPEPNKAFQCFVIDNMKDDFLLSLGLGVVINPTPSGADWVLTYGDIVNYHLHKVFYTNSAPFSATAKSKVSDNEEALVTQPSSSFLPHQAREVIAKFLKNRGVENPKILLLTRWNQVTKQMTQELVFNLVPQYFANEESYQNVMHSLGWYLPRQYIFSGVDEKIFQNAFMSL